MLKKFLEIRESTIQIYKKNEKITLGILKLLFSLVLVFKLNNSLGYAKVFDSLLVNLVLSIILIFLPSQWLILACGGIIITQVAFKSIEATILTALFLLILYLLFIRLTSKLGYFIIAVPLLFSFKIPFVIPIIAGLFFSPVAIVPVAIGTIIYYGNFLLEKLVNTNANKELADIPTTLIQMYRDSISYIFGNKEMLFTIIAFSCIIIITYLISRLSIDYIWYISIIIGAALNIILFIFGKLSVNLDFSVMNIILGTVFSALIVIVMQFYRCVIDYSRVEKVQYEDDDYYYYVKAIPKIRISAPQKKVKLIK